MTYTPPKRKTKVVFVQLGSPEEPTPKALRKYLRDFLGDPRVIDLPRWKWNIILNCFVLPFRPKKSARLYERIWDGKSFPLITNTENFTDKVRSELKAIDPDGYVEVNHAFLLSPPYVNEVYDSWEQDLKDGCGATKLMVIPMFPQYSESTIASGIDALAKELSQRVKIPTFEVITNFHRTHAFVDNFARRIDEKIMALRTEQVQIDRLVVSFHGMQKRRITSKGDDYYRHCYETFRLIVDRLKELPSDRALMTFQSRFGSEEWITPYTEQVVEGLVEKGDADILVCSPSFVVDCLETTDELGHELVNDAKEWGANVHTVDCLNVDEQWCRDFAKYTLTQAEGSAQDKEDIEYVLKPEDYEEMPPLSLGDDGFKRAMASTSFEPIASEA
jgi:ferrochelatase